MRDFLMIGSTPFEEDCAQVGSPDYTERARLECSVFKDQILRHYPFPENENVCDVRIKANSHDFGTYYEVAVYYDPDHEPDVEWAFSVEGDDKGVLATWDDESLKVLNAVTWYKRADTQSVD